jgi:hypothetical protein
MEQLGDGFRQMALSAQIWVSPQFLSAHSHLNGCCISFLHTVISKDADFAVLAHTYAHAA